MLAENARRRRPGVAAQLIGRTLGRHSSAERSAPNAWSFSIIRRSKFGSLFVARIPPHAGSIPPNGSLEPFLCRSVRVDQPGGARSAIPGLAQRHVRLGCASTRVADRAPARRARRSNGSSSSASACLVRRCAQSRTCLLAEDLVATLDHPVVGPYRAMKLPIKFTGTPGPTPTPAPTFGKHNDEILAGCRYSAEEIAALRQCGAVL